MKVKSLIATNIGFFCEANKLILLYGIYWRIDISVLLSSTRFWSYCNNLNILFLNRLANSFGIEYFELLNNQPKNRILGLTR